ncbi:MAG: hypothetical protein Q8900_02985 [Bacillota bacterium]|nr:hypothetical protein [Bacillota bacterium]
MNKKRWSVMVILLTIITVVILLALKNIDYDIGIKSNKAEVKSNVIQNSNKESNLSKKDNQSSNKMSNNKIGLQGNASKTNNNKIDSKGNTGKTNNNKIDSQSNNSKVNNNKTNVDLQKKAISNVSDQKNNKVNSSAAIESYSKDNNIAADKNSDMSDNFNNNLNSSENNDTVDDNNEKAVSVFKVDADKIQDELTLSDKEKILRIASKLSPVDYVKVKSYLESNNSENGIIETMKLLKKRLTDSDYKKIREIAGKFLNMDVIDSKI